MNRKQKRTFIKNVKKRGVSKKVAETYLIMKDVTDSVQDENDKLEKIVDGSKVMLDVDKIKAKKDWHRLVPEYKEFVEDSVGVVYTVNKEDGKAVLVSFKESPGWLFYIGDLILVEEAEEGNNVEYSRDENGDV